ncbi:glutathione S-transferase family protein [Sphingobium phenoxybenzoativorans]|uniref:Glutathione S-transferase family protein n=1 Tax=Sphingobium phenoxybenzoativorans TaxID=1592790 RepID=A0A975Q255_9SPHN|nr:glutathione S-transferase family protein [Sphingobium phenoxybenzoativorans]QUT06326.1 glutathione S-transferase family protein [Sphingobium phenoxybenzoativorans]
MTDPIIFYTNPMSRGQIARWMLEEVGAPYKQTILAYDTSMKDEDYLAINPMGKVPAIVHEGNVVTECAAICAYLADVFPGAKLGPWPSEKADYYRWLFFAAGPVEAAVTNRAAGFRADSGKSRMMGYGTFEDTMGALEKALSGRPFICGGRFTAADVYVGAQVDWGLTFGTIPSRPAFQEYAIRVRARPAYKKQKEIDNALIAEMQAAGR